MKEVQFHFDPVPPTPGGGGKFPWESILFGVGLLAIIIALVYNLTKPVEDHNPDN